MKNPDTASRVVSADLSRKELIAIIAKIRGCLYSVKNGITDNDPQTIQEEVAVALALSSFNVSDMDLVNDRFAPIPEPLLDAEYRAFAAALGVKEPERFQPKRTHPKITKVKKK